MNTGIQPGASALMPECYGAGVPPPEHSRSAFHATVIPVLLSEYKKIIIHCGIHKTGSSYLQRMLRDNAAVLEQRGIFYPINPHPDVQRTGNHSSIAIKYERGMGADEHFGRNVSLKSGCETLLISGEEFAPHLPREDFMGELVKAAGKAQLQFIFYLRRHDHLRESLHAQGVKKFLLGAIAAKSFRFDFFETLLPFVEAVGKQNIVVRPYNKFLWAESDLGADFCEAIGHANLWRALEIPREPINASFSREHTFLLSRQKSQAAIFRLMAFFEVRPLPHDPGQSKFFMSPQERQQFRMAHAASAQKAGDIFGISDMNTFLGIKEPDTDADWKPFGPDWELLTEYMSEFASWTCETKA